MRSNSGSLCYYKKDNCFLLMRWHNFDINNSIISIFLLCISKNTTKLRGYCCWIMQQHWGKRLQSQREISTIKFCFTSYHIAPEWFFSRMCCIFLEDSSLMLLSRICPHCRKNTSDLLRQVFYFSFQSFFISLFDFFHPTFITFHSTTSPADLRSSTLLQIVLR